MAGMRSEGLRTEAKQGLAPEPNVSGSAVTAAVPGSDETLRDGRVVMVRALCAVDAAGVRALWRRLDAPRGTGSPAWSSAA